MDEIDGHRNNKHGRRHFDVSIEMSNFKIFGVAL